MNRFSSAVSPARKEPARPEIPSLPSLPGRGDVPILSARREWECPNCGLVDVTEVAQPHTRMHPCAGAGGLTLPMVDRARARGARVRAVLREDYVGGERGLVFDDDGRPVMAAVTDYADGSNDVAVFAPTALGKAG